MTGLNLPPIEDLDVRLMLLLYTAGLEVFQDTGIRGDRPRDLRLPDLGVVSSLPVDVADYSNVPGSAYRLVIDILAENSANTEKARWYAERGIPGILKRADDR